MAVVLQTINSLNVYTFSSLAGDVLPTNITATSVIALGYDIDKKIVYEWSGAAWFITKINGALTTTEGALAKLHYISTDYLTEYFAEASPGTTIGTASWRVSKLDVNNRLTWAGGTDTFVNLASSLAVVEGLIYS